MQHQRWPLTQGRLTCKRFIDLLTNHVSRFDNSFEQFGEREPARESLGFTLALMWAGVN